MIKFSDDVDQIVHLWNEAFGDSRKEIEFFVDNIKNAKCLAYYDHDRMVSMMYLIKCKLMDKDFYYVYAVSTLKTYRNKGLSTELLEFAKREFGNLCLIPANSDLIDFYSKRGYDKIGSVKDIVFHQPELLIDAYLFEGCELEKPIIMISEV